MLLKNKVAVIYGAAGAVGSHVAMAFAKEGARVFLSGRAVAKVEAVIALRWKGCTHLRPRAILRPPLNRPDALQFGQYVSLLQQRGPARPSMQPAPLRLCLK